MRVTFTELHETEGFFGQESIAVGIGAFPKHLIYSYDLKKKIVLFPFEWKTENGKWNYERGFRDSSFYQFSFSDFCHTEVLRKSVRKIGFVEVDCDLGEFLPNPKLVFVILQVPLRNKARVNKLLREQRITKAVIAERSRVGSLTIHRTGRRPRVLSQYIYELVMRKSKVRGLEKQLREKKLISEIDRFAVMVRGPVFPRQLAQFQDSSRTK